MRIAALLCMGGSLIAGSAWGDTLYKTPPEVDAISRKSCLEERVPTKELATCIHMGNQLYMAFYTCHYSHVPNTWKCMQENVPEAIRYTDAHPPHLSEKKKAQLRREGYKL